MAKKRTKADRLERQTEQLGKRADRRPDKIEKKKVATREDVNRAPQTTLAPKSDEPTVLIPIEQQIQQRAYELYEQRGRSRRSRFGRLASSRVRDKGHAVERSNGIASGSPQERLVNWMGGEFNRKINADGVEFSSESTFQRSDSLSAKISLEVTHDDHPSQCHQG